MTLNDTMRGLLGKEWTTTMVANSHKQGRVDALRHRLQINDSIRIVMDYSQCWNETPQGRRYWVSIANDL